MAFDRSVSVVIPAYNRREQAIAAARSALRQSLPPIEVIIVDDASTDGIEQVDLAAIDPRIRLVRHPTNMGGGAARNSGIDAARGAWIALLDSDDEWLPDKLKRQFAQIEADGEGPDIVAAANVLIRVLGEPDRPYNADPRPPATPLGDWFLIDQCTYQTSTLLLPTQLARQVRFDPKLRRHQDWDFVLRLEAAGARFSYVHDSLAIYDCRPADSRISQVRTTQPTLDWFTIANRLVSPKARHIYYMNICYEIDREANRLTAWSRLAALSISYPLGLARSLSFLLRRVIRRHTGVELGYRRRQVA
jgi:glycosyltransferase involved in cell wall biosynthesis